MTDLKTTEKKTTEILNMMSGRAREVAENIATKIMGRSLARVPTFEEIRNGLKRNNCDMTVALAPTFIEYVELECDEIGYKNTDEENEETGNEAW